MPSDQVKRHVGLAFVRTARQGNLFTGDIRKDLIAALDPTAKVERYRRVWRISKLEVCGDFLCGRLGFSKSKMTEETFYDEKESDFVTLERDSREGAVSCFVLHAPKNGPSEAVLAFEEQPPDIRRQSFIGAFSKFLSDAQSGYEVESIREDIEFLSWLDQMDRIIDFSGTFNRPNPQWRPRTQEVQEIIEQTRASKMKLVAKASSTGEGLDVAESILGGIVEHAKGGYGDYTARGVQGESEFNYRHGSSEIIEEIIEDVSARAHDVFQKLMDLVLRKMKEFL
jgi:hypothetical protein